MTPSVTPETTLVILLGAHEYPGWPDLNSGSFKRSADEIKGYFTDTHGFRLPENNMLDLFDDPAEPLGVIRRISDFLKNRTEHMKASGNPARDVMVYHIGHGGFTSGNSEYYLALKKTQREYPDDSGFRISSLSNALKDHTRQLRLVLILDCCFAGSAILHFQSSDISAVLAQKTNDSFPEKGIALLCASSRSTPAEIDEHRGYTMFTGALLEVLRSGDPEGDTHLSLSQIGKRVRFTLNQRYQGKAARPEVHSPSQKQGDVAAVPFFPNPAAKRKLKVPFLASIFNYIITNQIVLLFSQEGMAQSVRHLLDETQSHFGKNNVIHLEPLAGDGVKPADFFADLLDQCHLTGREANGHAFRKCIEQQADGSDSMLLFITRFEYGDQGCGTELANILRSLVERKRNLNILIMGGERLADLYYVPGKPLSLLKGAQTLYWDELQADDIHLFCPETALAGERVAMLLKVSGGHPLLLHECIHQCRKHPAMDESGFQEFIKRSDYLWSRFLNMASDETAKNQLLTLLEQPVVSPYMPLVILKNSLIRQLFWNNLLRRSEDGKDLVWRSETIRETGQMVCDHV